MPSVFGRVVLFLSSYFPLALIFFVQLFCDQRGPAWIALSVGILGLLGMEAWLRSLKDTGHFAITVAQIQKKDSEMMSYVVAYIFPFLPIALSEWQEAVGLAIFLLVLCYLYVRLNLIYINPMLAIRGYSLYEVTLPTGSVHSLLTRRRIAREERIDVVKVGQGLLVEKHA